MLNDIELEATVFARYLGAKEISNSLKSRYSEAVEKLQLGLSEKEAVLLRRIVKYPFLISLVDGGLALIEPRNCIRKRLLTMFALMETDSRYTDLFLTTENQPFALVRLFYKGGLGGLKGLAGACMLKCLRWT